MSASAAFTDVLASGTGLEARGVTRSNVFPLVSYPSPLAWLSSTDLGGNQRKILPVVGTGRETYNIWGVDRWRGMRLSHLSPNRFVEGLNGDQFLRKKKLNIFFDYSQVLDLCGPKRLEVRHQLFDQNFGC